MTIQIASNPWHPSPQESASVAPQAADVAPERSHSARKARQESRSAATKRERELLFRTAASADSAAGFYGLGLMFERGSGVREDHTVTLEYTTSVCHIS